MNIIPKPLFIESNDGFFKFTNNTKIKENTYFINSIDYLLNLLKIESSIDGEIEFVLNESLDIEEYYLNISNDKITITASTDRGAFYAIQTLRQILPIDIEKNGILKDTSIECINIKDKPEFEYRGFMIDVSRHFFTKDIILRYIDHMSLFKFNNMHFHFSDDQGYRIVSKKYGRINEISNKRNGSQIEGLFGTKIKVDNEPHSGFYTDLEIKEIIEYARKRFIKVIPEIDLPGHFQAVLAAYPMYSCFSKEIEVRKRWGISKEVLCIGNSEAKEFIYSLIDEIKDLFETDIIHIGGDEAPKTHYKKCNVCKEYMKKNNIKNVKYIQGAFTDEIGYHLEKEGLKIRVWNEAITKNVKLNPEIQYWIKNKNISKVFDKVRNGSKLIASPFRAYYLDYNYNLFSLRTTYDFDPYYKKELEEEYRDNILGVECPLWTEWVKEENRINFQTFPRAIAVAERGWIKEENKDYNDFLLRLDEINKRLDILGITYSPKECYTQEYKGSKIKLFINNFLKSTIPSNLDYEKYLKK